MLYTTIMTFECICCNYRTKQRHHYTQHLETKKHRKVSSYAISTIEDYTDKQEKLGLRHIKEVEDLYVTQERERKELDIEMRFELCKKLVRITNESL
jgi:hypothetical protein